AFHFGEEDVHTEEWWGHKVALDFYFFARAEIERQLTMAQFHIIESVEREPYAEVEHPTRRAYILARTPPAPIGEAVGQGTRRLLGLDHTSASAPPSGGLLAVRVHDGLGARGTFEVPRRAAANPGYCAGPPLRAVACSRASSSVAPGRSDRRRIVGRGNEN